MNIEHRRSAESRQGEMIATPGCHHMRKALGETVGIKAKLSHARWFERVTEQRIEKA